MIDHEWNAECTHGHQCFTRMRIYEISPSKICPHIIQKYKQHPGPSHSENRLYFYRRNIRFNFVSHKRTCECHQCKTRVGEQHDLVHFLSDKYRITNKNIATHHRDERDEQRYPYIQNYYPDEGSNGNHFEIRKRLAPG